MKNQKLISRNVIRKFLDGTGSSGVLRRLRTPGTYGGSRFSGNSGVSGRWTPYTGAKKLIDKIFKPYTRISISDIPEAFHLRLIVEPREFLFGGEQNTTYHRLQNQNSQSLEQNTTSTSSLTSQTNTERPSTGNYTYELLRLKLSSMTDEELKKELINGQRGYHSSFIISELGRRVKQLRSPQGQLSSSSNNTSTSEVSPKETMYLVGQGVDNKGFTIELIKAELLDNNIDIKDKSDEEIVKLFEKYLEEQNAKRNIEPPKYVAPTLQLTPSTSPFAVTTPSSVDLNRADVRTIMNHYGLDTTPSLRKAFRKYLAGDRSQDISFIDLNSNLYRDWVAPFVVYKKKGGRLVSRNLVERFQKGKAIKGALKVIYNTLATPIHAVFGTPGKRRGYSGGRFGGAGVSGKWSDPTYSYNEIHPADTLFVPVTQTFNDAFADARRRGLDTFEFNGGTYGTELGDNPNWEAAGNARTRDAVIPVPIPADTIRKTSDFPRNDTIITDVAYRRYPISTSNINKIFNK